MVQWLVKYATVYEKRKNTIQSILKKHVEKLFFVIQGENTVGMLKQN